MTSHEDWVKTVDFLLIVNFWLFCNYFLDHLITQPMNLGWNFFLFRIRGNNINWKNASLRLKRSWALRWKNSQALSFLGTTFLFLDLDCLTSLRSVVQLSDLRKWKFSLGKETLPLSLSISEQLLSSCKELILSAQVDTFFYHSWPSDTRDREMHQRVLRKC